MYDSWQRKCKQLLHFRCKLLPVHPILRVSPAQPFLPHDSCVFVGDFQHLVITPHPIVLIVPTEFGAQASVLLAHGFMQVLFTPIPYPAEESAQPLSLGLSLDGPSATARLGPVVGESQKRKVPRPFASLPVRSAAFQSILV